MFFIIGTKFSLGATDSNQTLRCGSCGTVARFLHKKGMRFLTVFFIIPILPLSGIKDLLVCPHCKAKYNVE